MTQLTDKRQQNLLEALGQHMMCRIQETEGWYRADCRSSMPKKYYCQRCKLLERVAEGLRQ